MFRIIMFVRAKLTREYKCIPYMYIQKLTPLI